MPSDELSWREGACTLMMSDVDRAVGGWLVPLGRQALADVAMVRCASVPRARRILKALGLASGRS